MQAVRIIAYQNMASYRMPSSLSIKESYPLPPYSSVIGMVHAACGFEHYVPMKVSIQGQCVSHMAELYTRYEFGRYTKYDKSRHQVKLHRGTDTLGMTRGLGTIELLVDVCLVLHIIPEDSAMVEPIAEGLRAPKQYLSLGRWEDLLRIDAVDVCELEETELDDGLTLPFDTYIPDFTMKVLERQRQLTSSGTMYQLRKEYTIDPVRKVRVWTHTIASQFVKYGSDITEDACILTDNTPIPPHTCLSQSIDILPVFPA